MSAKIRVITVMAGNFVADGDISASATNNPAITVTARKLLVVRVGLGVLALVVAARDGVRSRQYDRVLGEG